MKLKCIINLNCADERKGQSPQPGRGCVGGAFAELSLGCVRPGRAPPPRPRARARPEPGTRARCPHLLRSAGPSVGFRAPPRGQSRCEGKRGCWGPQRGGCSGPTPPSRRRLQGRASGPHRPTCARQGEGLPGRTVAVVGVPSGAREAPALCSHQRKALGATSSRLQAPRPRPPPWDTGSGPLCDVPSPYSRVRGRGPSGSPCLWCGAGGRPALGLKTTGLRWPPGAAMSGGLFGPRFPQENPLGLSLPSRPPPGVDTAG